MPYKILVADDDIGITSVLGIELARENYEVQSCYNGLAAVERIMSWKPHLVILDYNMPGLDGRAVCSRIRRNLVGSRVIMLTAAAALGDRVAGLDAGADDYVCKPFAMDELLARVRAQLRDVPLLSSASDVGTTQEAGLSIRVLGNFQLRWRGTDMSNILLNRRQPLQLLKLLLASYDRPVLSDVLEEALWPEFDAERARRSLHVAVQRLRLGMRSFGPSRVQTCVGGYAFRLQPDDDLDLKRFDELAAAVSTELTESRGAPTERLKQLCELYAGPLFSEEKYAEWATAPRAQANDTFVDVLRRGAARCKQAGELTTQRYLLQRLADLDPSNEAHGVELAECLLEQGDAAAAATVLGRLRDALRLDLDVAPGPAWERLWRKTQLT